MHVRQAAAALAVGLGALWGIAARAADRPNVLLVCVDDLKPALGCYGDPVARSPNIDRLAARGVVFENAFCNQAVCSPSRNALLTGLRPQTLGIYDLGTNFRVASPTAVTLPQLFRQRGWQTEALGKIFHVGHGNHDDDASWSVPPWRAARGPKGAAYEAADVPDDAYPDNALADEAIRRLQAAKARPETPFFLAVGFLKPHLPFVAPKKYWDSYDASTMPLAAVRHPPRDAPPYAPQFGGELRQYRGIPGQGALDESLQRTLIHGYYAAMSFMDAQLGRVLDELDRLQLADTTIIVLWGDHGWHLGDHGMWCKHTNYEQATRIPVIVAAPGGRRGARSASLVESVDIYPTLCELAGLTAAEGQDGSSFARCLRDPAAATKDYVLHAYPRSTPERGPMIGRALRTTRYRLVEWKAIDAAPETAELELYDYVADPLETQNLAASRPDVVAALHAQLKKLPEARPQVKARPGSDRRRSSKAAAEPAPNRNAIFDRLDRSTECMQEIRAPEARVSRPRYN